MIFRTNTSFNYHVKFPICLCIAILGVGQATAQVDEIVLADTVVFITTAINDLESTRINQEIYRLNFDDCNLEMTISSKDTDEASWSIEAFWLPDIDESKMRVVFLEKTEEWALQLVCTDKARKIKGTSNFSTWNTFDLHIHSATKEPLISLGKALYYAIQSCKGLDRFKNKK